ncbi:hypothetical protein OOK31_33635 [Streptomyces sp. NBC_00249]|uniref:hypothetical protein n=1 Tax=Streptomyces sp. NBC_00249 TaxID=2975690 RepID=UPI0022592B70|nr:hypothetical protein [Streptomyces sp. NBC_00249]MCX5198771.1 hypothetical protein [Streptomyces sp. NBC_00249]
MEHEQTIPELRKAPENGAESDTPEFPPVNAETPDVAVPPRPRRRGRTALLIASALVLGTLAGTATGYAVQYHRAPTPLPPLAQQKLPAPKALAPDDGTTHKSVNANRWHATDGDLNELLVEPPAGAKVKDKGFDPLDSFAAGYEEPAKMFRNLVDTHFRRAATKHWEQGDIEVEVQLVQFKDFSGADDFQGGQASYLPEEKYAGNEGVPIPGVNPQAGRVWVYSKPSELAGYLPIREARAVARRGDTVVLVFYGDRRARPIAEGDVIDLAKRQLERL